MPFFTLPTRSFARAFVLLLPLFGAGCLEATAAQPDGGTAKEGGGTSSSSSMTTSMPDATSPMDSTVGTPDVSSGNEGGGSLAVIPQCMNPTAAESTCTSCVQMSCASDVAPAVSACTSFYACYQACACSDASCISACEMAAPMACISAVTPLLNCQTAQCTAACATPDASTPPPSDATAPADGGTATCKNPTATQVACGKCEEAMCASTVAAEKSDCTTFNQCFAACDCSDTSCTDACAEAAPSTCITQLEALQSCQTGACKSACSGSATDGGSTTTKDGGGSSGTIPDCKNPTSTETSTYNSCSMCDTTSCATYVNAAVSACTAYYSCFGTTDCSDTTALSACYSNDATAACDTAIDDLATCQGTLCYLPCSGF